MQLVCTVYLSDVSAALVAVGPGDGVDAGGHNGGGLLDHNNDRTASRLLHLPGLANSPDAPLLNIVNLYTSK